MAVVAEPRKIPDGIVSMILVDVMHRKNASIFRLAENARLWNVLSLQDIPIGGIAVFPISVPLSFELLIPPFCLAGLVTKKFAAFRSLDLLQFLVRFLPAHEAWKDLSVSPTNVLTDS